MTRTIYFFALLFFLLPSVNAQSFDWVRSGGSNGMDRGLSIDNDVAGNSYVTGFFNGTITLGAFTLTSVGGSDAFIAKYNNSGVVLWAIREGGAGNEESYGISCDANGNLVVTGIYSGTSLFGTATLTNSSGYFLARYDGAGNFQWARQFGNPTGGYAWDVDLDPTGHACVAGYYTGTSTFGSASVTSTGMKEAFILRYDAAGNFNWVRSMGGAGDETAYAITTDANGNIFTTGRFDGSATFGSTTLVSAGGTEVYLAKLDSSGNISWSVRGGGSMNDSGQGVDTDVSGNVCITGYFTGAATFGSTPVTSNGMWDCFVARYNSAGVLQWVENFGGTTDDYGSDLCLSVSGQIYVTGHYSGTVTIGNSTLTSAGGRDVLVMRVDVNGNPIWALSAGGTADEYGRSVAAIAGFVYITGPYAGNAVFGSATITNNAQDDIFVTRIKDNEVGMEENFSSAPVVSVYPNPAGEFAEVRFAETPQENIRIRIYNSTGQLCSDEIFAAQNILRVPLAGLAAGNYILEIGEGEKAIVRCPVSKVN